MSEGGRSVPPAGGGPGNEEKGGAGSGPAKGRSRKTMLLHTCCAPCSTAVLERLADEFEITGFFYNPNIHPEAEYGMRLEEAKEFYERRGIDIIEEEYDERRWHELARGHEDDPERGERCTICYRMRLLRTAQRAAELGMDLFATVLTISPHKDAGRINRLGGEIAHETGVAFYEADFKKADGFRRSMEISREEGLYRQDYCGCVHSRRERDERVKAREGSRSGRAGEDT